LEESIARLMCSRSVAHGVEAFGAFLVVDDDGDRKPRTTRPEIRRRLVRMADQIALVRHCVPPMHQGEL
jgi:hypothetical protein